MHKARLFSHFIFLYLDPLQVHKAQLRAFTPSELRTLKRSSQRSHRDVLVAAGQDAWALCNTHGLSLNEMQRLNKGAPGSDLQGLDTICMVWINVCLYQHVGEDGRPAFATIMLSCDY